MAISKAKAKARAKKAAATRKRNAAKKSPAKKSSAARRKSSHKKSAAHHGKTVASPTFGGKKFKCAGKKVRSGKSSKKTARVFCRRAEKAK